MKSTQKILVAGLILMVVLNLCTLGFIIYKSQQRPPYPHMRGGGERHGHGKFLGKRLDFTEEQEKSLRDLKKEHEGKISVLREKTSTLRKQQFELIKAETYDVKKGDEIAQQIGNVHEEMDKQMASHFLAIKALCTKEQLPKFYAFIDRISERKPGFGKGKRRDRDREEEDNKDSKSGC